VIIVNSVESWGDCIEMNESSWKRQCSRLRFMEHIMQLIDRFSGLLERFPAGSRQFVDSHGP
jgi:hypothetical protein